MAADHISQGFHILDASKGALLDQRKVVEGKVPGTRRRANRGANDLQGVRSTVRIYLAIPRLRMDIRCDCHRDNREFMALPVRLTVLTRPKFGLSHKSDIGLDRPKHNGGP